MSTSNIVGDTIMEPAKGNRLVIGCTRECKPQMRKRIADEAKARGFDASFVTLMDDPNQDVDAIVSPGGLDPHPKYYTDKLPDEAKRRALDIYERKGRKSAKSLKRDAFESGFFRRYFAEPAFADVPALGICYGMQMLAIVAGLPLIVDITEDMGIARRMRVQDMVELTPGSRAAQVFSALLFLGYERHHQALDLGFYRENRGKFPSLAITGVSNGGKIAEVIEFSERPAMGVQFHPESKRASVESRRIFAWLIDAAIRRRKNRAK